MAIFAVTTLADFPAVEVFTSAQTGLVWFTAVYIVAGAALGAIAAVNARA